jgi:hypothetical protein
VIQSSLTRLPGVNTFDATAHIQLQPRCLAME